MFSSRAKYARMKMLRELADKIEIRPVKHPKERITNPPETVTTPDVPTIPRPKITTTATATPEITTDTIPEITTDTIPEITTATTPEVTTGTTPEVTTGTTPEVTTGTTPEVTTGTTPEVTTGTTPEQTTATTPEQTTATTPEVTTTPKPEITTAKTPEITTATASNANKAALAEIANTVAELDKEANADEEVGEESTSGDVEEVTTESPSSIKMGLHPHGPCEFGQHLAHACANDLQCPPNYACRSSGIGASDVGACCPRDPCPEPADLSYCVANTCRGKVCDNYPEATCEVNYCNDCETAWFVDGFAVDCVETLSECSGCVMHRSRETVDFGSGCRSREPLPSISCSGRCESRMLAYMEAGQLTTHVQCQMCRSREWVEVDADVVCPLGNEYTVQYPVIAHCECQDCYNP